MKYDLNRLNWTDFEKLIQSIARKILGSGSFTFGEGPDGGRELTFNGRAPFPSSTESWDGYWVVQAKFRSIDAPGDEKDFNWVKKQLTSEFEFLANRKVQVPKPDNYLLFTNILLTASAENGGRDRASRLQKEFEVKYGIRHIRIISRDDIFDFLDAYQDIRFAYYPFILPGDVLAKMLESIGVQQGRNSRIVSLVNRWLETEFRESLQSRLDHAGKLTSDKINLDRVFIDMEAFPSRQDDLPIYFSPKFAQCVIGLGNSLFRESSEVNRYVLIAGPGYGKSTLTQFLAQVYRAHYLFQSSKSGQLSSELSEFLKTACSLIGIKPTFVRLPIRIILKEYGAWISHRQKQDLYANVSVLEYWRTILNKKSQSGDISLAEMDFLVSLQPLLFIFDGLDEVPASSNRQEVLREVEVFVETGLRALNPEAMVIATTRPQGYFKEFDESKYLHFTIQDLSKADCRIYLEKLMEQLVEQAAEREIKLRILLSALEDEDMAYLMRSPLQASIMAILVKSGGELVRNRFDLFTDYYDIIFRREKQNNVYKILSERSDTVRQIHYLLGLYLQNISARTQDPSAMIDILEFKIFICKYLKTLQLDEEDVDLVSDQIIRAVTDRLVFISEIQDGRVGFSIRSMQEYFAANGYIHNVMDRDVMERIRAIGSSSYWSNTLLFCIGYLSKYKSYLHTDIESYCLELNGSRDDILTERPSAIPKIGSWLALDILREGIFRDNPGLENTFAHFLRPLFEIGLTNRHQDLAKLPGRIIDRFIRGYVEESVKTNKHNRIGWIVAGYLETQGISIFEKLRHYWPVADEGGWTLVYTLFDAEKLNKLQLEIVVSYVTPEQKANLFQFLRDNYKVFKQLSVLCKKDAEKRKILIELLFVFLLSYIDDDQDLKGAAAILGVPIVVDEWRVYVQVHSDPIEILSDCYTFITAITPLNKDLFGPFISEAATWELNLITTLSNFLVKSDIENYLVFDEYLRKESLAYRKIVSTTLGKLNSFFAYVFEEWESSHMEVVTSALQDLDTYWKDEVNGSFHYFRYFELRHDFLTERSAYGRLTEFIDEFLPNDLADIKEGTLFLLYAFIDEVFLQGDPGDLEFLLRDTRIISQVEKGLFIHLKKIEYNFRHILAAIYLLDDEQVYGIINILNNKVPADVSDTIKFQGFSFEVEIVFIKLIKVLKRQLLDNRSPCYRIVLDVAIYQGSDMGPFWSSVIPWSDMIGDKRNIPEDPYKALLLMGDPNYGLNHFEEVVRILKAPMVDNIRRSFLIYLKHLLPFFVNCKWMDETLIELSKILRPEEFWINGHFVDFVRQYVGNKPATLPLEI